MLKKTKRRARAGLPARVKPPAMQPLGAPPRVIITPVVQVRYHLLWEYDGNEHHWDAEQGDVLVPVRRQRTKYVTRLADAYRIAALRLIFMRRDLYEVNRGDRHEKYCTLCDDVPSTPEDPGQCRYHGGKAFERLRRRLARWLRWRDERRAQLAAAPAPSRRGRFAAAAAEGLKAAGSEDLIPANLRAPRGRS